MVRGKVPHLGSGGRGVQMVSKTWQEDGCWTNFQQGNDIPKGTPGAERRLPAFLQLARPKRAPEMARLTSGALSLECDG